MLRKITHVNKLFTALKDGNLDFGLINLIPCAGNTGLLLLA